MLLHPFTPAVDASSSSPTTSIELAWAAGFLDGEGHFCFALPGRNANGGRGTFRIRADQTSEIPLERLKASLGGRVHGPRIDKRGPNRRPTWFWQTTRSGDALRILGLLWPYLCEPKRQQIAGALEKGARALAVPPKKGGYQKTEQCKRGHPWDDFYLNERGMRVCRPCNIERAQERRLRQLGPIPQRECEGCGLTFQPWKRGMRFHSDSCRLKTWKAKRRTL